MKFPCPFTYASGDPCTGHIAGVEAFKAELSWERQEDGTWRFFFGQPRSHFHVYCSEKGNHAGYKRGDDSRMKFYADQLPDELWQAMTAAK